MLTIVNAAWKDDLEQIKFLVENGADLNYRDLDGRTAIFIALGRQNLDILKYLLDAGASTCTSCGIGVQVTLLMAAAVKGNVEIAKFLLEEYRMDLTAKDKDGKDALYYAYDYHNAEMQQYLQEQLRYTTTTKFIKKAIRD